MACAGTASFVDVEPQASAAVFDRVGGESTTDRCAGWRAVFEVKAAVVLRALDDFTFDQAFAEVGIAVGADAVGGVELARVIAVKCEGLFNMIKTDHIFIAQIGSRTDFDPTVTVGSGGGVWDALVDTFFGRRQFAFNVMRRIFNLF